MRIQCGSGSETLVKGFTLALFILTKGEACNLELFCEDVLLLQSLLVLFVQLLHCPLMPEHRKQIKGERKYLLKCLR